MGKKLTQVPKDEKELNDILEMLYTNSLTKYENNESCNYTGLLEIISSEANIVSSIHKIKSNQGSKTPGTDNEVMNDILHKNYDEVIQMVKQKLSNYQPKPVKREYIPKPGKKKLRPLGIPTISDRIVQQCVKNVIEPIAEGQFFKHSYGFRPMRSAEMAIFRVDKIAYIAKCNWVVEGDIKSFFDNVNHNVMIKCLWDIGVRDKRVLSIIKEMLKAGIMNECARSELGTPQGGIISPLLANIYLNKFDRFITNQFERKELKGDFNRDDSRINSIRKYTNIKTAYFIRYADDWVIMTDSKEDAIKLKEKAQKYLKEVLKLELSEEKTHITNMWKKPITFLGYQFRCTNLNGHRSIRKRPEPDRLDRKMKELKREIFMLRKINDKDKERLVQNIIRVNSIIVGIGNYFQYSEQINVVLRKYAWTLDYTGYKSLKKFGGKWIPAEQVSNLPGRHQKRSTCIPAIQYGNKWIGITSLAFTVWRKATPKNPLENPYTREGREIYNKRRRKRSPRDRMDEINTNSHAFYLRVAKSKIYNFEYFMNRPYVYNRDKGKCKICGGFLETSEVQFHHIDKTLSKDKINKVSNLISVHPFCHNLIHKDADVSMLDNKTQKNIQKYKEKFFNPITRKE